MTDTATKILAEIMRYKRISTTSSACKFRDCQNCYLPHLPRVAAAVKKNEPVQFVLPAFPAKSPNPEKVLGPLPDLAEQLALSFLNDLGKKIKTFYPPGIKIHLCSDGRVFSDVVGIKEDDVSKYQHEVDRIIKKMKLSDISTFNLDDVYQGLGYDDMRANLLSNYSQSLDCLKQKIRHGNQPDANGEALQLNQMYRGITRFLFEDSLHRQQSLSRTAMQKRARQRAYEVIRRSNAWSQLIADYFPHAVRLSIHPQICGSNKLAIRLVANESWITPWHGVAIEKDNRYTLVKKSEAEAIGAKLVYSANGRGSHYSLTGVDYEF